MRQRSSWLRSFSALTMYSGSVGIGLGVARLLGVDQIVLSVLEDVGHLDAVDDEKLEHLPDGLGEGHVEVGGELLLWGHMRLVIQRASSLNCSGVIWRSGTACVELEALGARP